MSPAVMVPVRESVGKRGRVGCGGER